MQNSKSTLKLLMDSKNGLFNRSRLMRVFHSKNENTSKNEARSWPHMCFIDEKERQLSYITRVEKIDVKCIDPSGKVHNLIMNKGVSTPTACAMHLGEVFAGRPLALVNDEPYSMHKPLIEDCDVSFSHFMEKDPMVVNEAYWRTCSFILGYVMEAAFKRSSEVMPIQSENSNVSRGSFGYKIAAHLDNWTPSQMEFETLSQIGAKLAYKKIKLVPLEISLEKAKEMFQHNCYKLNILQNYESDELITVYEMGNYVDMADGPLINNTQQIGRFSVVSIEKMVSEEQNKDFMVRGVSIPSCLPIHSWTYNLLLNVARKNKPLKYNSENNSETEESANMEARAQLESKQF